MGRLLAAYNDAISVYSGPRFEFHSPVRFHAVLTAKGMVWKRGNVFALKYRTYGAAETEARLAAQRLGLKFIHYLATGEEVK